ncbi:MAG: hypothetical protein WC901_01355 [Candidatus Margulisiibacteriota bacterium]
MGDMVGASKRIRVSEELSHLQPRIGLAARTLSMVTAPRDEGASPKIWLRGAPKSVDSDVTILRPEHIPLAYSPVWNRELWSKRITLTLGVIQDIQLRDAQIAFLAGVAMIRDGGMHLTRIFSNGRQPVGLRDVIAEFCASEVVEYPGNSEWPLCEDTRLLLIEQPDSLLMRLGYWLQDRANGATRDVLDNSDQVMAQVRKGRVMVDPGLGLYLLNGGKPLTPGPQNVPVKVMGVDLCNGNRHGRYAEIDTGSCSRPPAGRKTFPNIIEWKIGREGIEIKWELHGQTGLVDIPQRFLTAIWLAKEDGDPEINREGW